MLYFVFGLWLASVLFAGAIFGFFYAWVCSTMWGLDQANSSVAIQAMQQGADEYIHKPIDIDELDNAVVAALEYHASNKQDAVTIPKTLGHSIVGSSHAMKEIYKTIGRVALTNASVMITGESGTGKEMVARAIHKAGRPKQTPFVALNCAALVENLLESELFGHAKGAFTGAVAAHPGLFREADGGTLL